MACGSDKTTLFNIEHDKSLRIMGRYRVPEQF
jgi:hypothetical protein